MGTSGARVSGREARIERVVKLREERLHQAVKALEELRVIERQAASELALALAAREQAERARRELCSAPADIRDYLEAEEWLRSCAIAEELATHRVRHLRVQLDRVLARVKEARTKVRQLEQLQERLKQARRARENRTERTLEDEIGQRVAQSQRGRR